MLEKNVVMFELYKLEIDVVDVERWGSIEVEWERRWENEFDIELL